MDQRNLYPAKILLFGEHVLLLGSSALALPIPAYAGKWVESDGNTTSSLHERLLKFALSAPLEQVGVLDTRAFYADLKNGLSYESNIPIGYGLGSSGALCAAVYDRYCQEKTKDLMDLKSIFSQMEGYFHGASSGIDPLTSYVERPLLIRHKTDISIPEMSPWSSSPIVFLIDSAMPRYTEPLVRWFLEQCETSMFSNRLRGEYLPAHEVVVNSWLTGNATDFWPNLQLISRFQLAHFTPMIPATLRQVWQEQLDSQAVTLKVCGAGGGGFMLGFSQTMEPVLALAQQFHLVFPFTQRL